MRSGSLAAGLLLLLLLPVPLPAAAQAPSLVMEAWRDADQELRVKVTAGEGQGFVGRIVVSHYETAFGHVVDRVADFALDGDEATTYRIPGVRANVGLDVRVVDATVAPGRLPHADLYDGATLWDMPHVMWTTVGAGNENARTLRPPVLDVDRNPPDDGNSDFRSLVTSKGIVVAGYQHRPTGQLGVRVSHDGGHTWGYEHILAERPETMWSWGMGELDSGAVRFFVRSPDHTDFEASQPWNVYDLDTLTGSVGTALPASNTLTSGFAWIGPDGMVVRPDGTALLLASPFDGPLQVWRIESGGMPTHLANVTGPGVPNWRGIAASGSHVVVSYGSSDAVRRLYVARSTDAGLSFGAATEVESMTRASSGEWEVTPRRTFVDGSGLAHVLAQGGATSSGNFYVRLPYGGTDSTLALAQTGTANLAVRGARVAIMDWTTQPRYLESSDHGATFARGPAFDLWWGHTGHLDVLPDGRPLPMGRTMHYVGEASYNGVGVALPFDPSPALAIEEMGSERFVPRLRDLRIPAAGSGGWGQVVLHNEGNLSRFVTYVVLVNGAESHTSSVYLGSYEATDVSFPLPALQTGDSVEVRVGEPPYSTMTWAAAPPPTSEPTPPSPPCCEVQSPPTMEPNGTMPPPTPIPTAEPTPPTPEPTPPTASPSAPSWWDRPPPPIRPQPTPTPAPAPAPSPTPTPSPAPTPTPTPSPTATPTSPTAPAPAPPRPVTMVVTPARIELAAGRSVDVSIILTNVGDEDLGAEAPLLGGLPEGVTATVLESGWASLPQGASKTYIVRLAAAQDAQLERSRANVSARYASDEQPLTFSVDLAVTEAAAPAPTGLSAVLARTPKAVWAGAGATGLLGVLGLAFRTDWGRAFGGLALVPLYSRLKRADVLKHEVRAGIHDHVRAHPGARFEEIRKALALPAGGLQFHLRVLEREGFVRVTKEWTRRRYYAQGAPVPIAVSPMEQTLSAMLAREPGLTAGQVAQQLGMSRQLARYHLKRLERQGWLKAEGEGALVGYKLTR